MKTTVIKLILLTSTLVFSASNGGTIVSAEQGQTRKGSEDQYFPVDWARIHSITKPAGRACVDGFLGFEGTGDYPTITLWETEEAMKHKRPFRSIDIDSESASKLILERLGAGVDNWQAVNGAYVKVQGIMKLAEDGTTYFSLGHLTNIAKITVFNNGLEILSFESPKSRADQ
jgi:hypothetical protein